MLLLHDLLQMLLLLPIIKATISLAFPKQACKSIAQSIRSKSTVYVFKFRESSLVSLASSPKLTKYFLDELSLMLLSEYIFLVKSYLQFTLGFRMCDKHGEIYSFANESKHFAQTLKQISCIIILALSEKYSMSQCLSKTPLLETHKRDNFARHEERELLDQLLKLPFQFRVNRVSGINGNTILC